MSKITQTLRLACSGSNYLHRVSCDGASEKEQHGKILKILYVPLRLEKGVVAAQAFPPPLKAHHYSPSPLSHGCIFKGSHPLSSRASRINASDTLY